mmetsp:Transcript_11124/g.31525  ORF Transcript_11124/g.31525 Transcript_11124/m.31525 type:complete len:269 (-) Transcript_11124:2161-2967(-)
MKSARQNPRPALLRLLLGACLLSAALSLLTATTRGEARLVATSLPSPGPGCGPTATAPRRTLLQLEYGGFTKRNQLPPDPAPMGRYSAWDNFKFTVWVVIIVTPPLIFLLLLVRYTWWFISDVIWHGGEDWFPEPEWKKKRAQAEAAAAAAAATALSRLRLPSALRQALADTASAGPQCSGSSLPGGLRSHPFSQSEFQMAADEAEVHSHQLCLEEGEVLSLPSSRATSRTAPARTLSAPQLAGTPDPATKPAVPGPPPTCVFPATTH